MGIIIIIGSCSLVATGFIVHCFTVVVEQIYLNKVKYPRMVKECKERKEAEKLASLNTLRETKEN